MRNVQRCSLHTAINSGRSWRARGRPTAEYEGGILFLPYHPDPEIAGRFIDSSQKKELAWDFGQEAPENMKRQVFDSLHYILENFREDQRQFYLRRLKKLYGFCIARKVDDIDGIELVQIKEFEETMQAEGEKKPTAGIVDLCRKAL